jgi:hypothetical protein
MTTEQKLEALRAKFPTLILSHGYIGNCGFVGRTYIDDRSWRIFTNLQTEDVYGGKTRVSIPLTGPDDFDVEKVADRIFRIQSRK